MKEQHNERIRFIERFLRSHFKYGRNLSFLKKMFHMITGGRFLPDVKISHLLRYVKGHIPVTLVVTSHFELKSFVMEKKGELEWVRTNEKSLGYINPSMKIKDCNYGVILNIYKFLKNE